MCFPYSWILNRFHMHYLCTSLTFCDSAFQWIFIRPRQRQALFGGVDHEQVQWTAFQCMKLVCAHDEVVGGDEKHPLTREKYRLCNKFAEGKF